MDRPPLVVGQPPPAATARCTACSRGGVVLSRDRALDAHLTDARLPFIRVGRFALASYFSPLPVAASLQIARAGGRALLAAAGFERIDGGGPAGLVFYLKRGGHRRHHKTKPNLGMFRVVPCSQVLLALWL